MVTTTADTSVQLFNKAFAAAGEELQRTEALEKDVVGMLATALHGVVPVLKLVDSSHPIHVSHVERHETERGVILGGEVDDRGFQYEKRKIIFLRRDGKIRFVNHYPDGGYYSYLPFWGEPVEFTGETLARYFAKNDNDNKLDLKMIVAVLDYLQAVFTEAMTRNEARHKTLERMVKRLTPVQ